MCKWNLTDPETGLFLRKGTKIVSTSAEAVENVSHKCPKNHKHRPIGGTIRYKGERMNMSTYAGGYTPEFCSAIITGVEKTLNKKMVEAYAVTGFSSDKNAQRRRALDGDTVYDEAKARRLASMDDVPTSIRRSISRAQTARRREMLDDVPVAVKRNRNIEDIRPVDSLAEARRRELLDDLPAVIRRATRSNQQQEPKRGRTGKQPESQQRNESHPEKQQRNESHPQKPPEPQVERRMRGKQKQQPLQQQQPKESGPEMLKAALFRGRNNRTRHEDPCATKRRVERNENSSPIP